MPCFNISKIECPLFKDYKRSLCLVPKNNWNDKITMFKDMLQGNIIIDEYKFAHDYTGLYCEENEILKNRKLELATIGM